MSEKNEIVVASSLKEDLRQEAGVHCKAVANSFMQDLKGSAGAYVQFAVNRIFDEIIDYMNKKLFD